jgi:UDP-N-acetylmuramate--alanine ligase
VYAAREDPMPGVTGALITDQLLSVGGSVGGRGDGLDDSASAKVRFVPSWSDVAPLVAHIARAGDLVMTVGAGDVTMIGPEVLRLLGGQADATALGAVPG